MPDRRLIANAVLFQLGWLACVLGGNSYWLAVPAAALLVHFFWTSSWAAEGKLVVSVMLAGAALDSFLLQLGVLEFRDQDTLVPLWLAVLWALLGTTLNHCLGWTAKPIWRAVLLGAVGGPLSYLAGARLADVGLPLGTTTTLVLLGCIWALVMPVLHGFAHLYREQYRMQQLANKRRGDAS
ncbi:MULTISPECIES: DUF2878 domain-containing protein [Pseudomonas]|uniref:DUF2878 domain-containing protein n=1 Tax=Pseudomonas abyssi TaxID=170540 RepID=A0A395R3M4_9PSED|nr:DUF2878 domain-containing protein [Halopseudomonas gallaeciensis]MAG65472.1 hypothetical protein [Pseudomonadales bacterium]RGP54715.1 hypothetical protein ASB58_12670 [Halopseudomonas gallaeciensis]|tara:strand:- start:269 stop:814 length:546 start_codon:yes stop_codon:yes gene_type:complete